jgi:dTDP-4-amino-4,6-dideoxygalactose transaminase
MSSSTWEPGRYSVTSISRRTTSIPGVVEALITSRTVGIIPVHLFGLCADMPSIDRIARRHGLWVVEDAACGFGARLGDRHAGTFGDLACFSFHPRKSITTGEGGMVTTPRRELDAEVRSLRDHGASRSDFARHQRGGTLLAEYEHLGYNYRMTDIQAALGCAQMDRATGILDARARLAHRYDEMLRAVDGLRTPVVPAGYAHGYQAYVCLFAPEMPTLANVQWLHEMRNRIMGRLEEEGIATRQGTHAPVTLGYYMKKYGLKPEHFPNAYIADRLTLTLPLFPQLTTTEQELVCDRLSRLIDDA